MLTSRVCTDVDGAGPVHPVGEVGYDVVIPTIGRPSLLATLEGIAAGPGPWPEQVVIVDDRRAGPAPEDGRGPPSLLREGDVPQPLAGLVTIVRSGGLGPAAARNAGWRACCAPWVAFLDDDVRPPAGWRGALVSDLLAAGEAAGTQGRIHVPMPADRRPTDWERDVGGLAAARWATADMAYRRDALVRAGGFDERFPRAYREDADLAVRLRRSGHVLVRGRREVTHPVGASTWTVSVRRQAGNADDMLMRRLHGRSWRRSSDAGRGRARHHVAVAALLGVALVSLPFRRARRLAGGAAALAALDVAAFAAARIRPGPRTAREVAVMAATSAVIPPVATAHLVRGWVRARRLAPATLPAAVLFDRDGTLVHDVPYNGDPALVDPVPGAREALDRLRVAGVKTAVVSNQSGLAGGVIEPYQVEAVNRRIEELLGPLGHWGICAHGPDDGCRCRKPATGLVHAAAEALGVPVTGCVVIGDIGADVEAARRAGARGILVPTAATRAEEIAAADRVAADLGAAVDMLLGPRR